MLSLEEKAPLVCFHSKGFLFLLRIAADPFPGVGAEWVSLCSTQMLLFNAAAVDEAPEKE